MFKFQFFNVERNLSPSRGTGREGEREGISRDKR